MNFRVLLRNSVFLLRSYPVCDLSFAKQPIVPLNRLFHKSPTMSKTALVILAEGAEEMETVITVDMLRRGGVTVTLAGLDSAAPVLCSRQVTLVPDKSLADALAAQAQYDAVILPGGLDGSERLSKSSVVGKVLKEHEKLGKIVAAICAAPTAFVAHGVASGKRVTSYPTTKDKMAGVTYVEGERVVVDGNIVTSRPRDSHLTAFVAHGVASGKRVTSYPTTKDKMVGVTYVEGERVVVDGNIVTSRGPGTAYWFGLKLIELLVDQAKADQVEKGMLISNY